MSPLPIILAVFCGAVFSATTFAQEPAAAVAPQMREISPGLFEIGKIQLDQKARTVRFPGALNMKEGNIEYLLVTTQGSVHESLLVSEIQPTELHFAMLLLGAKGSGQNAAEAGPAPTGQIDARFLKSTPKLAGERVAIFIRPTGETAEAAPVEDWILNTETKKPMSRGPWIYNGSMFNDGHFLAQIEGAFGALVTYPAALINNPRKGNDNDAIWTVNTKAVPAPKTPLEITIQILPATETAPKP